MKKLKKLTAIIGIYAFILTAVIGTTSTSIKAADDTGYQYDESTNTLTITTNEGTTAWASDIAINRNNVKSINVAEGVTTLGYGAIYLFPNLENLSLPEGLTTLEMLSIANCPKLTSLTLPESLTTIDEMNLIQTGITSIVVPKNVTSILGGSFSSNFLENLVFLSETPPNFQVPDMGDPASSKPFVGCPETYKVYVPATSLEAYKTAENWRNVADHIYPLTPLFAQGATWNTKANASNGLSYSIESPAFNDFLGFQVNGNTLDLSFFEIDYTTNTLTLKPSYLNTLQPGTYTLTCMYTYGSSEATFIVSSTGNTNQTKSVTSPKTSAASKTYAFTLAVTTLTFIGLLVYRKKHLHYSK